MSIKLWDLVSHPCYPGGVFRVVEVSGDRLVAEKRQSRLTRSIERVSDTLDRFVCEEEADRHD